MQKYKLFGKRQLFAEKLTKKVTPQTLNPQSSNLTGAAQKNMCRNHTGSVLWVWARGTTAAYCLNA